MNDHQPEHLAHLLEQLSAIEPQPGAIERALDRTRKALADAESAGGAVPPRGARLRVWRISRWAAAIAILVMLMLALAGPLMFSNSGAPSAFAQVQAALKEVPSVAYRHEVLEAAAGIDTRKIRMIIDYARNRVRQETADGEEVSVLDLTSGTKLQLFPRRKAATLTTGWQKQDQLSGFGGFVEKLRSADPKTVQRLSDAELDGRHVNRYRIPPDSPLAEGAEVLFFVDPQTQLPARIESALRDKNGRIFVRLACTDFSFEPCDASLFELVPPKDYRLQREALQASPQPTEIAPLAGRTTPVQIEFRLAESTAGDGLSQAAVGKTSQKVYLHVEPVITRQEIKAARLLKDGTSGYMIELTFTAKGAERMSEATSQNRGKLLAVLINGRVVSAPRILATISNGARITGAFTAAEASDIVRGLRPAEDEAKP